MISRAEAETMLAADALAQHDARLAGYREWHKANDVMGYVKRWTGYVSLPLLETDIDCGLDFPSLFKGSMVVVHPGYHLYRNGLKPADGYMELYMRPLKDTIASEKDAGRRVIVYAERSALKETLDIVGPQGNVMVPTINRWAEISCEILGCEERSFVGFLRRHGLVKTEVCGESSDFCVLYVGDMLKDAGIAVKYGISYPETVEKLQQPRP